MSELKIGSLFSGYAGLDRAVEQFFGAKPAWFVEFDKAPSKILATHYPDVPNYGDVTKVKWTPDCPVCGDGTAYYTNASVYPARNEYYCHKDGWFDVSIRHSDPDAHLIPEPVDIMTGGFPCQDVSLAGARAGMKDGTRSGLWSEFARAIGVLRPQYVVIENVRGLLSAAAGDSEEWTDAEIGELESGAWRVGDGDGGPVLRAAGAVLGDLAGLGYDAQWCAVRASDAGAPHQRYRVFILAHADGFGPERSGDSRHGRTRSADTRAGATTDLMPTPQAADATGGHASRSGARSGELLLPGIVRTLPTPQAHDALQGKTPEQVAAMRARGHGVSNLNEFAPTLPTPTATYGGGTAAAHLARKNKNGGNREAVTGLNFIAEESLPKLDAVEEYTALWGALEDQSPFWVTAAGVDYWPAISRWAQIMGRPSPSPTLPDGKNGNHRLNPAFTEWLMGQPAGWITGVGLTRNEALKACGNGVVTQQALLALSILWPYVSYEMAA